jgi:hypothetical protein
MNTFFKNWVAVRISLYIFTFIFTFISYSSSFDGEAVKKYKKTSIPPIDESWKDPTLNKYLEKLKKAVEKKDVNALVELISPNIDCDHEYKPGVQNFLKVWKLDKDPEHSSFWGYMSMLLNSSGAFYSETKFILPYWYNGVEEPYIIETYKDKVLEELEKFGEPFNEFEFYIVAGKNVNVRAEPSSKSKIITQISYEVIYLVDYSGVYETINDEKYQWLKVRLWNGEEGFIYGKYLFNQDFSIRAIIENTGNGWKITIMKRKYYD